MGLPVIEAHDEADAQCAGLSRKKGVIGVLSDDTDMWMNGVSMMRLEKLKSDYLIEYSFKSVLKYAQKRAREIIDNSSDEILKQKYALISNERLFTSDNFKDVALLMGTDYNHGLNLKQDSKCGKKTKFNTILEIYIKYCMSIENLLENCDEVAINDEKKRSFLEAKKMYSTLTVFDPKNIDISLKKPNDVMIKELCKTFLGDHEITSMIALLNRTYTNYTYRPFRQSQEDESFKHFASNRIKRQRELESSFPKPRYIVPILPKSHNDANL
jgi:5'-3' exonuclease